MRMKSKEEIELEAILEAEGLGTVEPIISPEMEDITLAYDSAPVKTPMTTAERAKRHREKLAEEKIKERAEFDKLNAVVSVQLRDIAELQDRVRSLSITTASKSEAVDQLLRENSEFRSRIAMLEAELKEIKHALKRSS